ncbi:LPXTG cell wall anchor domain-containing protein [Streptomyces sp. Tu 2975]|uniref:LPXTG cell wall anchor domain-containing protein n=1 Tax=Streptomyces sp. Tu 2975 TaxID=2676871 RepID=UPI001FC9658E|nr:LPXTG cell wall anchor domain-containing protein [Streptomyces sp. Tu 2975]
MKPIRLRVRARLASAAAVVAALGLALTGLPGLTGEADAAPMPAKPLDKGIPCKDYFDLADDLQAIAELPEFDASRAKAHWDTYDYVNPGKQWDGLERPSEEDIDRLKDLEKQPPKSQPKDRIYWAWLAARESNPGTWDDWSHWRDVRLIRNSGNDPRGKAFEKKVIKDHGLIGPEWICQKEVEFKDPDTGKTHRRQLDAYNTKTKQILEIKSNGQPDPKQRPKDIAWSKDKNWRQSSMKYVYGQPQEKSAATLKQELSKNAPGRVTEYNYRSDKVEKAPGGGVRAKSTNMQPPGKPPTTGGGANDLIRESRANPKAMAEFLNKKNAADPSRLSPRGAGGVDFTTLDLRYVGKPVKGEGLDYGFSATEDPEEKSGWGGKEKAQLISDAFLTWLALTPDKFWVNLNPDEPNRVMDAQFGKTDAGRILLEADLRMKHDFFKAMDPKTDLGKRFWASLPKVNGRPCFAGIRNWIEPKTATVREQDGGIYILDAPLKLESTPQDFTSDPGGDQICDPTEAERDQAQQVIDRMIVPEVEKTINTAPQYADLRRVHTARVAAEWIRLQDAKTPTDYRAIINSNDVSSWPLRAPNQNWDKNELFKKYRDIFLNGEFQYDVDTDEGVMVYIVGGVDFSKQPKRNISKTEFTTGHSNLPRQTQTSVKTLTDNAKDDDGNVLLLGGNTTSTDTGGGGDEPGPDPTPTPTPAEPGGPTDRPTTPGPDPSTPPATGGSTGGQNDPDPDGDLADTGSDTPIGLIAGIAAALAALGGGLIWWKRRRTAVQE